MFAKFYEIPSLAFQDIEKPECCGDGRMDGRTDVKTVYTPTPPTNTVCRGYNYMKQNSKQK